MRFFVFIIGFLGCSIAQASELPDCQHLKGLLTALPLTASDFADAVAAGQIVSKRCEWDGESLRCEGVIGARWSAAEVSYQDSKSAHKDLVLADAKAAGADLKDGVWTLNQLTVHGFHVETVKISETCVFQKMTGNGVEVELNEGTKVAGVSVSGLPTFASQVDAPSAGFLPPVIRYFDIVEFAASGFITGSLGLGVNVAPGEWYGVHGLLASDDAKVVEVGVNTAEFSTADPYAVGELSYGERLSGKAEWGDSRALTMRELDTGAFSRADQRTRAAGSLRSAGHELSTSIEEFEAPGADRFRRAKIRFGSDEALGRVLLKTDAEHESRWTERRLEDTSVSVHSALVALSATVPFSGRGWAVAPAVDMNMSFGVVPTDDGFEASTTASVLPNVFLHTGMVGRFDGWAHRIGLVARAGLEVYGFSQREPLPPRVPNYLFDREPGGYFVGASLEQSIEAGEWRFSLPVGLTLKRRDEDPDIAPWTMLSIQGPSNLVVETNALCSDGCSTVHLLASAELRLGRLIFFGAAGDAQFGRTESYLLGGPAASSSFSPAAGDESFSGLVGLRALFGRYYASARTFSGSQISGFDAAIGWSPGLGWNVNVGGGVKFESADIGLTAGLSHRY